MKNMCLATRYSLLTTHYTLHATPYSLHTTRTQYTIHATLYTLHTARRLDGQTLGRPKEQLDGRAASYLHEPRCNSNMNISQRHDPSYLPSGTTKRGKPTLCCSFLLLSIINTVVKLNTAGHLLPSTWSSTCYINAQLHKLAKASKSDCTVLYSVAL